MKSSEIERVDICMYRNSEYNSYEDAFKNGGIYHMTETYGYSSTLDSIHNCFIVAKMLNENDIRVRMVVDGVALRECFLSEAQNVMHEELEIK